jgi:CRP/FNR family transcriptional regulator
MEDALMTQLQFLKKIDFFSSLDPPHLKNLLRFSEERSWPKGAVLFQLGDPGDSLYIVLSGRVKCYLDGGDGRQVTLALLGPGEIVGELALFDPEEKRSASVSTVEDTVCLVLSRERFLGALAESPSLAMELILVLSRRLRDTSQRLASLVLEDTFGRLACFLNGLAEREGRRLADGSILFNRPTQEEIAHIIGTSRETVNRLLRELESQGVLRLVGRKILLYKRPL